MLVELAIGDAYGAGFEYVRDRRWVSQRNDLSGYVKHPTHRIKPGHYTDDTQMSLAIAELIVDGVEWSPINIADRFVSVFHRDKRPGYAGGFFQFLKKTHHGEAFLRSIRPTSDKSGAAMRSAPIGFFASVDEVIEKSTIQAELTHDTAEGINASVAVSLMAHYFLYGLGPKAILPKFLATHVPGQWTEPWLGQVRSKGYMSTRAALASIMKNDSLSGILKSAVTWMGDTDTVAAIALGIGACSDEVEQDLPENLIRRLENGPFGYDFLASLNAQLLAAV